MKENIDKLEFKKKIENCSTDTVNKMKRQAAKQRKYL